jgi:hypothetical protein
MKVADSEAVLSRSAVSYLGSCPGQACCVPASLIMRPHGQTEL